MDKSEVLRRVRTLIKLHQDGILGGEVMPEDVNCNLLISSKENYLYYTLPMALNYQRSAYKLWESVKKTYLDEDTRDVFIPKKVLLMSEERLREKLTKHKVALQPNKQPAIWRRLCQTFEETFNGDVREFFQASNYNILEIKAYMNTHKKRFPYLSGTKISNYWLYVIEQYTDCQFNDRRNISVAPDTHVMQASVKLGVTQENEKLSSSEVSERWKELLTKSEFVPIDVHTPLWLWSRRGFKPEV